MCVVTCPGCYCTIINSLLPKLFAVRIATEQIEVKLSPFGIKLRLFHFLNVGYSSKV